MELSDLERTAIESILALPVDGMEVVRRQFADVSVSKRDYTGVGFFARLAVPPSLPPVPPGSNKLRAVLFEMGVARVKSDPEELILFHLYLDQDGYLCQLEGVTTAHDWPDESEIEVCTP